MTINDFISLLLDDTLENSRYYNLQTPNNIRFEAIKTAIEDCRNALTSSSPHKEMVTLLKNSHEDLINAQANGDQNIKYWFHRYHCAEWIASVFSAILIQNNIPIIVPPTAAAFLTAVKLISLE